MLNIDAAPRDIAGLLALTRSTRQRLALNGGFLQTDETALAFAGETDERQAQLLYEYLADYDVRSKTGQPQLQPEPQTQGPSMSNQPPVVPPQFPGFPSFPGAGGPPGFPGAQQPPQQAPQGAPGGMPGMPPMPLPGMPQMGGAPSGAPGMPTGMPAGFPPGVTPPSFPGMPGGGVAPTGMPSGFPGMPQMGGFPGGMPQMGPLPGASPQQTQVQHQSAPPAPQQSAVDQELHETLAALTQALDKNSEAMRNSTAFLFNTLADLKTDADFAIRVQFYVITFLSMLAQRPVDQVFSEMAQYIKQLTPAMINDMRAFATNKPAGKG